MVLDVLQMSKKNEILSCKLVVTSDVKRIKNWEVIQENSLNPDLS